MRAARALFAAVVTASVVATAPADAAVQAEFALAPSAAQAGGTADLRTDVRFSSPDGDDVRDLTVSLAHGLLASPFSFAPCPTASFEADTCDPKAQIGQGTVTASAFGTTVTTQARTYLITPQTTEIARMGMILKTPFGRLRLSAPVAVRTSPDLGVDIRFTDILRDIAGIPVTIDRIELTLTGKTAAGEPFVRLPTRCAPAVSKLTMTSYGAPASPVTASSEFTPTGCDTLPFTPSATASATLDDQGGVAFTSTIATGANNAATSRVAFELPDGIVARPSVLARACAQADPNACPATATVGSAAALTSFAPARLLGRIVLMSRPGTLPGLTVVFPAPFALRIDGATGVSAAGTITTTFDGLPDVPITSLEVRLDGGANSLLAPERELCTTTPALTGQVSGHNGASASVTAPVTVSGCVSGKPPEPKPAGAPTATAQLRGLATRRRRVSLNVTAPATAPAVKRLDVCLPAGLAFRRSGLRAGLRVVAGGRLVRTGSLQGRCVRLTLPTSGSRKVAVTVGAAALRVGTRLARRVRSGSGGRLTVTVTATDNAGGVTTLRATTAAT